MHSSPPIWITLPGGWFSRTQRGEPLTWAGPGGVLQASVPDLSRPRADVVTALQTCVARLKLTPRTAYASFDCAYGKAAAVCLQHPQLAQFDAWLLDDGDVPVLLTWAATSPTHVATEVVRSLKRCRAEVPADWRDTIECGLRANFGKHGEVMPMVMLQRPGALATYPVPSFEFEELVMFADEIRAEVRTAAQAVAVVGELLVDGQRSLYAYLEAPGAKQTISIPVTERGLGLCGVQPLAPMGSLHDFFSGGLFAT